MKLYLPTSIFQLTLIGFSIVVLPLVVALVGTVIQVDRLAAQMKDAVFNAARAVQSSRILVANVFAMERSAGQYYVLRDQSVLRRYRDQRAQLSQAIEVLSELSLGEEMRARLTQLSERERAVFDDLMALPKQLEGIEQSRKESPEWDDLVRPIPFAITQVIARDADDVSVKASQLQRLMLVQAVSLIPIALLMAILFSVLITRPLRQLAEAIRGLGGGEFSQPIRVSGPQDLRDLSEHLEWLRTRLLEVEEQKANFLRHVSHELKTPLTAIREGTELLNEEVVGILNEEQSEVARILHKSGTQLQKQIEDLLKFNTALTQDYLPSRVPVNLTDLVKTVVDEHKLARLSRQIQIVTHLQYLSVDGDPEQLRVVVDNLISNAIKYSPDGGTVNIYLTRSEAHACIDVKDEGPGIEPKLREKVFEPFFQGPIAPRGPIKGTGLGLAISHKYVKLHQGTIDAINASRGAHMRVTLPMKQLSTNAK